MQEHAVTSCKVQEANFLTLHKKSAWERALLVNLDASDRGLRIRQGSEYALDREMTLEELTGGVTVTDFAVGPCHLLYILDARARTIWVYDSYQESVERIECIGALLDSPTSITYAPGTLYVADADAARRVFTLAEVNWQIRWAVGDETRPSAEGFTPTEPFTPVDLAVSEAGDLYALDGANRAVLKFDAGGWLAGVFGYVQLKASDPKALALSPEGYLYVLDPAAKRVWKFDTGKDGEVVSENLIDFAGLMSPPQQKLPVTFQPSGFAVDTQGDLYVGDGYTGGPRPVTSVDEDDRFIRRFDKEGKYLGEVGDFRGAVAQLALDGEDWLYVFGEETEKKISVLKPGLKYSKLKGTSLVKGRYFSQALDSAELGTEWHKFVAEADIPANTQIQISHYAADEKQVTIRSRTTNLDKYLEDAAELSEEARAQRAADLDALDWSPSVVNATDALILGGVGRYLWLRVEIIGNEEQSPSINSLRLDFPRSTYLRYLPAVYQEDDTSRDFLERFLSLFETFFAELEGRIAHIARYFDVDSSLATGDFLRWLASWLAVSVDKGWSEERLRALVRAAPEIYKKRGTRAGLEEMVEIFTGERPLIIEHFQTTCAHAVEQQQTASDHEARVEIEELYRSLYGTDPYCFCVLLRPFQVSGEEERKAVRRIIDAEKPAHTCAGMLVLQPWIHLDMHTYLDVNTYLSQPSARLDLNSAIPRDTLLDDRDEAGQLERKSRLNVDITLT